MKAFSDRPIGANSSSYWRGGGARGGEEEEEEEGAPRQSAFDIRQARLSYYCTDRPSPQEELSEQVKGRIRPRKSRGLWKISKGVREFLCSFPLGCVEHWRAGTQLLALKALGKHAEAP